MCYRDTGSKEDQSEFPAYRFVKAGQEAVGDHAYLRLRVKNMREIGFPRHPSRYGVFYTRTATLIEGGKLCSH